MHLLHRSTAPARRLLGACFLALLSLTFVASATACSRSGFSGIVVFGDSLSDTGRLYALTHGGFPMRDAYWQGRQSNGPVWVEYLADRFHLEHRLEDYAVVGALTAPTPDLPSGNVRSDQFAGLEGTSLSGQLATFASRKKGRADPEALYLVQGGANDLISPLTALMVNPPTPEQFMTQVQAIATRTVTNLVTQVASLRAMGARYIAVVNIPNFGNAPRFVSLGGVARATVTQVVATVNEALSDALDQYDATAHCETARIDAAAIVNEVVADPETYGLLNVTTPFMTRNPSTGAVTFAARPEARARRWFFWDDLHPTTHGHRVFADAASETLFETFPALRQGQAAFAGPAK